MLIQYRYCGISRDGKRIWGAIQRTEVDLFQYSDWRIPETYLFWGSKTKPIIKNFRHTNRRKGDSLYSRIKDKKSEYSGYIEIYGSEISTKLPDLEREIESYFLIRKLKR